MNHRQMTRAAASKTVSQSADEMCRRSIAVRRMVSEVTGRDFMTPCPACPYRDCVIRQDEEDAKPKAIEQH
jgi:hypothetical protein